MTEKIYEVFADVFGILPGEVSDEMSYNSFPGWDSLKHLELVSALEDAYGISLEMDDVIMLESVGKAKEIIQKYRVSS